MPVRRSINRATSTPIRFVRRILITSSEEEKNNFRLSFKGTDLVESDSVQLIKKKEEETKKFQKKKKKVLLKDQKLLQSSGKTLIKKSP